MSRRCVLPPPVPVRLSNDVPSLIRDVEQIIRKYQGLPLPT